MKLFLKTITVFIVMLSTVRHTRCLGNSTWLKISGVNVSKKVNPAVVSEQVLWEKDEAGVDVVRCPLITYTPEGNLLAVAEGRITGGDAGLKYIVIRRSTDGGQKWGAEVVIHNDTTTGKENNLGVVLVDDTTKEIFVFYASCAHVSACKNSVASVMYTKSADDGLTWEKPFNVTAQAGPRDFAPGPGYGIQKKFAPSKGRLIVCGHGGELGVDGVFCLLSDDHGSTWRWGAEVLPLPSYTQNKKGDFVPDECQPIELPDGSVMVNVRNQYYYHCNCRMVMMSYDGLDTISLESIRFDSTLIDPAVAASILYYNGVVFFSNPASETNRTHMTIRWSYDNGTTWPGSLLIWQYASGYSTMTAIPEGLGKSNNLYLVFEKGKKSYSDTITLVTISINQTHG